MAQRASRGPVGKERKGPVEVRLGEVADRVFAVELFDVGSEIISSVPSQIDFVLACSSCEALLSVMKTEATTNMPQARAAR